MPAARPNHRWARWHTADGTPRGRREGGFAVGDVIEVGCDGAAADPDDMRLYQRFMVEPDVAANQALSALAGLVAAYNAAGSEVGGRVDATAVAALSSAIDSLTYLDGWVDRVGQGFRMVDAAGGPMEDEALDYFVGPADLAVAKDEGYTFGGGSGPSGQDLPGLDARVVTRPGGTRVVVVTVDDAVHEISRAGVAARRRAPRPRSP